MLSGIFTGTNAGTAIARGDSWPRKGDTLHRLSWPGVKCGCGCVVRICGCSRVKCGFQCGSKSVLYPLVKKFSPQVILKIFAHCIAINVNELFVW